PGWISDYVYLLTHYTQEKASPAFAWSLGLITSPSNLRSFLILSFQIGDHLAGLTSWFAWIMALIFLAIGWRARKLVSDSLWSLAILAMLMFSPHLSNPEDLNAFVVGSPSFTAPTLGFARSTIISLMGLRDHRWEGWPFITICLIAFGLKIVLTALVLGESYRRTKQKTSPVLE
ncbi:MAG: hypothetical protein ACKO23_06265, partial [Gemmataceae bacterium]